VGLNVLLGPFHDLVFAAAGGVHHQHEFHGVLLVAAAPGLGWLAQTGRSRGRTFDMAGGEFRKKSGWGPEPGGVAPTRL
jgi:hypothetical protein